MEENRAEEEGAVGGEPAKKVISNYAASDSDSDDHEIDPMKLDYDGDYGIQNIDDPSKNIFVGKRTKDIPCKFHDGISGKCWKAFCPYGHEKNTGGVFAKKNPELALAASTRRPVTYVMSLPVKSKMEKEAEVFCKVAHVSDPSRFFIRPTKDVSGACSCKKLKDWIPFLEVDPNQLQQGKRSAMDEAYFALNGKFPDLSEDEDADEDPTGLAKKVSEMTTEEKKDALSKKILKAMDDNNEGTVIQKVLKTIDERLHKFMMGLNYSNYQEEFYLPHVELVAVRVNQKWARAVVLPGVYDDDSETVARTQLLETGEIVNVTLKKDICRLPDKFAKIPTGVFRCSLFGISPVWEVWGSPSIALFKELVQNKELRVIVKRVPPNLNTVRLFENRPYSVKIMFSQDAKWIDVAEEMNKAGYGILWNPFPKRPFATTAIDTKGLDVIHKQHHVVPDSVMEVENRRLFVDQIDDDIDGSNNNFDEGEFNEGDSGTGGSRRKSLALGVEEVDRNYCLNKFLN